MTGGPLQLVSLVAESTHFVWGRFDHEDPAFDPITIAGIVGAILLAVAAGWLLYRLFGCKQGQFTTNSPPRLFAELCRAHRLPSSSRRLLKRLAAAHGLANPAMLFVEPHHFDTSSLPADLRISSTELQLLRAVLFP